MAPIRLGNLSVEIAVNNIDGFLHDVVDLPSARGFWVTLTVRDDRGKTESFPLVGSDLKIMVFNSYQDALYEAAHKLKGKKI